jgi:hypothetical protein
MKPLLKGFMFHFDAVLVTLKQVAGKGLQQGHTV